MDPLTRARSFSCLKRSCVPPSGPFFVFSVPNEPLQAMMHAWQCTRYAETLYEGHSSRLQHLSRFSRSEARPVGGMIRSFGFAIGKTNGGRVYSDELR